MIPKTLHIIWVGNESKRPDNCINTWRQHNPDWTIKIWGNEALATGAWINAAHMREMAKREMNGVADMMRWEILFNEGGFLVDADSICLRPLDDSLLDCEAFACWENEMVRPGLIAAGYFACSAGNNFVRQIVSDIHNEPTVVNDMAWKTVGPQRLTDSYRKYRYHGLRLLPSYYFIPEHFTGVCYDGPGPVYARQAWGSTRRAYDQLHLHEIDNAGRLKSPQAVPANHASIETPTAQAAMAPVAAAGTAATQATADAAAAPTPSQRQRSPLETKHAPYFVQRVNVCHEMKGRSRLDVFKEICEGRRVLHMGCADWPITDPKTSLHLALEPFCRQLDGFDIHAEALAGLAPYAKGRLFNKLEKLTDSYDMILVPEVMEHVSDVGGFLKQLDKIHAPHVLLTVPDAYQSHPRHFDYLAQDETFIEVVHPDHNCWYTPYTFLNVIRKYTSWKTNGLWFFNNISLLGMFTKTTPTICR